MALAGSLTDFGLPDVMEFISQGKKTGVLTVKGTNASGTIGFEKGEVVGASFEKESRHRSLTDYLSKSGQIPPEKLAKIASMASSTGRSVEEVLIKGGYLTEEALQETIRFKIQEVVDEIFSWKQGTYSFDPDSKIYTKSKINVTVNTEFLIMESLRRQDEWPKIAESLPQNDVILVKKGEPLPSINLTPDEEKLLSLIDGKITVKELIEKGGLGRFTSAHALYRFTQFGLIEKAPKTILIQRQKEKLRQTFRKVLSTLGLFAIWIGTIAIIFALLSGSLLLGNFLQTFTPKKEKFPIESLPLTHVNLERKLITLNSLLSAYCLLYGHFPATLHELETKGIVPQGYIDEEGIEFHYTSIDKGRKYKLWLKKK